MKNNKKKDKLFVNTIVTPDEEKKMVQSSQGEADKNPSCIYNHKRHAAGSVIKNKDGSDSVCTERGEWVNFE